MPSVYPEFYTRFACRAANCRHSCCRGWEIDVDAESAAMYQHLSGPLGAALRNALEEDAEGWHFRLDGEERCPLLRADGLCRLICELGEDALCDICALHPRFFAVCGDYELCGLGLSCEAAAALLLEGSGPLRFTLEGEALGLEELLARLDAPCEAESLRFTPRTDRAGFEALLAAFARTEAIDAKWPEELAALADARERRLPAAGERGAGDRYDRILAYALYRQLERLGDETLETLLEYARRCTEFVYWQDRLEENTAEHLRRWSEQIEYSTENVGILLEAFRVERADTIPQNNTRL